MKTINELQDEVIEEFSDFDDWMDKYQLLIDLGNEQEPLAPEYKTESDELQLMKDLKSKLIKENT